MKRGVDTGLARFSSWTVGAVAVLSAVLSFHNIRQFAVDIGIPTALSPAYPLFIDGLLLASSLAVLRYARRGERSRLAVGVLIFGVVNSIFTNAYAASGDLVAMYGHALPPLALFLTVELLVKGYQVSLSDKDKAEAQAERARIREQKKQDRASAPVKPVEPAAIEPAAEPPAAEFTPLRSVPDTAPTGLSELINRGRALGKSHPAIVADVYETFTYPDLPHADVARLLDIPTKTVGTYRRRAQSA